MPVFISDENKEYLAAHWHATRADYQESPAGLYIRELQELAEKWDDLRDSERGVLVLACDLIHSGELP